MFTNERLQAEFFDGFTKVQSTVDVYTDMDRAFYWHEGNYDLELLVDVSNPDRTFMKKWSFSITQEDVKNLSLNSIAILRAACSVPAFYNFAYCEYKN